MNEIQKKILLIVFSLTEKEQDFKSRDTGFGYGFYRWIFNVDVAEKAGLTHSQARDNLRKLVNCGRLLEAKRRSGQYCRFSLPGWDNCTIMGDYFIEFINSSSDQY